MPGDSPVQDPFKEVASFLVEIGKLDQRDADIYALGLKKFVITSNDVIHEFTDLRQNTAGGRLQRLARNGYFENTPSDVARKNVAKKFKVVSPRIALKKILSASERLQKSLALIEEYSENPNLAPNVSDEDEIWVSGSNDTSISRGAAIIQGAKENVKICSNDCSWIKEPEIEKALNSVSKKKVPISVVANPDDGVSKQLKNLGAKVLRSTDMGVPFCVVDDRMLITVGQSSGVRTRHILISTMQPYMVKKHLELFNRFARYSKPIK